MTGTRCFDDWCTHVGATLIPGYDFNGDGRRDLLCHDPHRLWLSYTQREETSHQIFRGGVSPAALTGWYRDVDWCGTAGSSLHVGDWNGDGRDDLLCKTPTKMEVMFANAVGQLPSVDRGPQAALCGTGILQAAHLNLDGFTDLLCRAPPTPADPLGQWQRSLVSRSGQFGGVHTRTSTKLCALGELLAGDFDRDGLTDIACKGSSVIDIAYSASGRSDWSMATSWCSAPGERVSTIGYDGDSLICDDGLSVSTLRADADGHFDAP